MAKWQDDLRPASFRGVSFYVDSHQYTGGRRVTFHEFPDRDKPFPEDLGKSGSTFKVDGYLLGDDVKAQKLKMKEAAEAFGPGDLVHPWFGSLRVQCGAFSIEDTKTEGRKTKITFQFYEAGDNRFPDSTDDKQDVLADNADAAKAASKNKFDSTFSIAGLPQFAVNTARSSVTQAADAFTKATKGLRTEADKLSDLAYSIRNLKAEVNDLIQAPALLSKRLQDAFDLLQGALGNNKDAYKAIQTLTSFQTVAAVSPYITANRKAETKNVQTFDGFMRQTASVQAAQVAAATEYESTDEAITIREQVSDSLEAQITTTDDDDVFQTFEDVRALVVKILPDSDAQLPNVQNYFTVAAIPSLVLAYELFGNVDSEQDIIDRNQISNPAVIPGGRTLEVLDVRTGT